MKKAIFLASVSAIVFTTSMARAQTVADAEVADSSQDIVVTAQKRAERLQDVPIAVTVASAEQLANSGVQDLPQLQTIVPGLNVTEARGSFQPSIRGIGTRSNVVENTVSLYIDGVYLPLQQEGTRDLADAAQVTVLKGPQGTLFGRNATAGVIQITTRGPEFETHGQFNLSYGSYQTINTNAYVTTGLSDRVAVSLSGAYKTQGKGWGTNQFSGREEYKIYHAFSTRGKLLFELSDTTSLLFVGDYLDRRDSGSVNQPLPGTLLTIRGYGPLRNRYDSYNGQENFISFKGGGISATLKSDLGFAELVSISAYRKSRSSFFYDVSGVPLPLLVSDGAGTSKMYSQELQLLSKASGPLKWVAGAYYFNYRQGFDYFNRNISPGFTITGAPYRYAAISRNATLDAYEKSESIAPFAQADFEVLPGTTVTAGLRYTYEKRTLEGSRQITNAAGVAGPVLTSTPKPATANEVTWRFAVNQKLSDDLMIFASYSRGFKSGGFNIATPQDPAYLPEMLDDWEVGLKSQFWNRRITFNVTGFYYDYKNIQIAQFSGNPPSQVVSNGAAAEIYGVDVDLSARLVNGLTLSVGMELLHPEFTDYMGAAQDNINPAGGLTPTPGGFDAKGQRLPFARKYVITGALDYVTPAFGGNLAFNVTATRSGNYYFAPDNIVSQPAYTMLNAGVKLSNEADSLSIRFGVTNALDEAVIVRTTALSFGHIVAYSAPREYTVTLGAKF